MYELQDDFIQIKLVGFKNYGCLEHYGMLGGLNIRDERYFIFDD
jgi:hypothetical protein